MAGIIEPITNEYDVSLNIIRGQVSETFARNVAELWNRIRKPIVAYYLGDHDPAGLAIEQSLIKKLRRFCPDRLFRWQRLAVSDVDFQDTKIRGFTIKGDTLEALPNWPTEPEQRLRLALKSLLGRDGLRCVSCRPAPTEAEPQTGCQCDLCRRERREHYQMSSSRQEYMQVVDNQVDIFYCPRKGAGCASRPHFFTETIFSIFPHHRK